MKLLYDSTEFHRLVLDMIKNKDYTKFIENTVYKNSKDYEMGFIQGMIWAALHTSQCNLYVGEEKTNE